MQHFGYGPRIQKIRAVYNIKAQVKVTGTYQNFFLERGVKQGCPLSIILYIIFAEILQENLRQNKNIKGIKMRQNEVKTWLHGQHSIYLGDNNTFKHLETQLKPFEKATNIKYNKTKCTGMWLGSNRANNTKPMGFKWTSQKTKVLGYM